MEKCGHYRHWRLDFDLVQELGLRVLRYGPPLHRTFLGPKRFDWEFADLTFSLLFRHPVPFLYLAGQLFLVAFEHSEIIVSELTPLFLHLALDLFPLTGGLVLVHTDISLDVVHSRSPGLHVV